MAVSTLLGQAKAGDAFAIAQLMNQQLQVRGLTVKVSRELDCLRLRLEGETLLSRDGFVNYVENALGRLGCPLITQVEIVAVELGQTQPLWQAAVALQPRPPQLARREPAMVGVGAGSANRQLGRNQAAFSDRSAPAVVAAPMARESAELEPQFAEQADFPLEDEARFEADVAAIAGSGLPATPNARQASARSGARLPMPSRTVIARQWFVAGLFGTLATLGITAAVSALFIPVVASMTGMAQLSGFALAILLALQLIVGIPIAGLVIGYAQTRMLRRYLKTVGGWQLITPLGCLIGFFIAVIVHFVGHSALNLAGYADSLGQTEGSTGQLLSIACTTLGVGCGFGFLGLSQFAILNGRMRKAQRWIASTGFSGMVAWLVGGLAFQGLLPHLDGFARLVNMTPLLLAAIVSAVVGWLVFQTLSSLSLAALLRPAKSGKHTA